MKTFPFARDWPMRVICRTNLMLNTFDFQAPRDTTASSPHIHDNFEQGSVAPAGVLRSPRVLRTHFHAYACRMDAVPFRTSFGL